MSHDPFLAMFERTLADARRKYELNQPEKEDSWRTLPLTELRKLLLKEINELEYVTVRGEHITLIARPVDERKELLDVINVALMLAERLGEKQT